jgi:ankyrin repeat protein
MKFYFFLNKKNKTNRSKYNRSKTKKRKFGGLRLQVDQSKCHFKTNSRINCGLNVLRTIGILNEKLHEDLEERCYRHHNKSFSKIGQGGMLLENLIDIITKSLDRSIKIHKRVVKTNNIVKCLQAYYDTIQKKEKTRLKEGESIIICLTRDKCISHVVCLTTKDGTAQLIDQQQEETIFTPLDQYFSTHTYIGFIVLEDDKYKKIKFDCDSYIDNLAPPRLIRMISAETESKLKRIRKSSDKGEPSASENEEETIFDCARNGNLECLRSLLEKGEDINKKNPDNYTPLMFAAKEGHLDCVGYLLDKGADTTLVNYNNSTAFILACTNGQCDCIHLFLTKSVNYDTDIITALLLVSEGGFIDCIEMLFHMIVDINISNEKGETALIRASTKGQIESIQYLISKGSDLHIKTNDGMTALMYASGNGHFECVDFLIKNKARVNDQTNSKITPLMYAAGYGHLNCVGILLDNGADIDAVSDVKRTALMYAAGGGHSYCVDYLIESGANLMLKTMNGMTALMIACKNGMANYIEVMNLLIDGGEQGISDINAQDENGMTSLMIATQRQDMEALELLLKENADLSIKDNQGKTAMDYVNKESKDGEYKIETLLKKYKKGGNKNRRTKTRRMNASISSGKKK